MPFSEIYFSSRPERPRAGFCQVMFDQILRLWAVGASQEEDARLLDLGVNGGEALLAGN